MVPQAFQEQRELELTVQDVQRVLAIGRLLLSVLTPEEMAALRVPLDKREKKESRMSTTNHVSISTLDGAPTL